MTDKEIEELFNNAIEESESGDLGKAISLYESILSNRPELARVRLELALANFRALNYAAARSIANDTLADPEVPDGVKVTVRAFLEELESQSKPNDFSAFVSAGWIYDDNPASGPSSSIVNINGQNIILTGATPEGMSGIRIFGGVSHRYLFQETFNVNNTPISASWESSATAFRDQYLEDGGAAVTLSVLTARTGPSFLAARKWAASIPIEYNYIYYAQDPLAWYVGVNPSVSLFLGGSTVLSFDTEVEKRDYFAQSNDDLDSKYYAFGMSLGHTFDVNASPSVNVGARVFKENARTNRRSNEGWELSAGLSFNYTENTTGYMNYSIEGTKYQDVEAVFNIARDETLTSWAMGVNYLFQTQGLLNESLANISWSRTSNNSSVSTFTYDRNQVVLNLSKSFD